MGGLTGPRDSGRAPSRRRIDSDDFEGCNSSAPPVESCALGFLRVLGGRRTPTPEDLMVTSASDAGEDNKGTSEPSFGSNGGVTQRGGTTLSSGFGVDVSDAVTSKIVAYGTCSWRVDVRENSLVATFFPLSYPLSQLG